MSETVRDIEKMHKTKLVGIQILHRRGLVCISISLMVFEIMVQRISKITPLPKIWGNIGPIVPPRESSRIVTYTESSIQIVVYLFVRYPLSNLFAQTHGLTQKHTRQVKNQFFVRCSVSRDRKCALLVQYFEFLTVYSNSSIRSTNIEVVINNEMIAAGSYFTQDFTSFRGGCL